MKLNVVYSHLGIKITLSALQDYGMYLMGIQALNIIIEVKLDNCHLSLVICGITDMNHPLGSVVGHCPPS
jgi:hypothetical protein